MQSYTKYQVNIVIIHVSICYQMLTDAGKHSKDGNNEKDGC